MSQEWKLVPVEPTEDMVINGFESVPSEGFSDEEVWEQYSEMSGCQQAALRAKLCWAAMLASVPAPPANVDPVVIGYFYEGDVIGDQFSKLSLKHYYRRHGAAEHEYIQPVALIRQEDHRTHIIRLQAENEALQQRLNGADQRVDDLSARLSEIVGAVKSINRGSAYEVIVPGDDEPQYRQRKEWVDWILQLCEPTTPQ